MEKKFFDMALSYGLPFLELEGAMPYCWVRLKYTWESYQNPWSLWSYNSTATLFFSFFKARWIISNTRLTVCWKAVLYATILLSYNSQIIDRYSPLFGVNIGNISHPFEILPFCMKLEIKPILIFVHLLNHHHFLRRRTAACRLYFFIARRISWDYSKLPSLPLSHCHRLWPRFAIPSCKKHRTGIARHSRGG